LVEVLDEPEENGNNAHILAKFYDSNKRSKSPLGKFLLRLLKQIKNVDGDK